MIIRLNDAFEKRRAGKNESGAAMIFALLILMVLAFLSVTMTLQATTQAQSQREITLREAYVASAYSAMETAVFNANNSSNANWLESRRGILNAQNGTPPTNTSSVSDLRWRIYTERVVTSGNQVAYYVYATGYVSSIGVDQGITLRGIINGTDVTEGVYNSEGGIQYRLSVEGSWAHGLTGVNELTFLGTSKLYSFDSALSGSTPSGTSSRDVNFYSKGKINITNVNHGLKTGTVTAYGTNNRCLPENICEQAAIIFRELGFDVDLTEVTDNVNTACPNVSYPVWTASQNDGVLDLPANACVGGLVFDVNTTVPASNTKTNPLRINVKGGNVVINPGIKVNTSNVPTALIIRSTGNTFTADNTSKSNLFITAPNATCSTKGSAMLFGGISCQRVSLEGSSTVYLDLSIRSNVFGSDRKIWNISYVEEL